MALEAPDRTTSLATTDGSSSGLTSSTGPRTAPASAAAPRASAHPAPEHTTTVSTVPVSKARREAATAVSYLVAPLIGSSHSG